VAGGRHDWRLAPWRRQRRSYFAQRARAAEALAAAEALRVEVTERKKANDALDESSRDLARSNAELEEFADVASHDLQEPLRMVVGFVQLLERRLADKLDDETREFIGFAVDGMLRMKG
jgi:light-regulated signal transduction histidine kinase (bacteriophytochrome)